MNTVICLGLLMCVSMAYASALPVSEPEPANLEQVAPVDGADESLDVQESRWGGGWGRGGGWGGRGGGWGGRGGGWGGRGGWGYGGGYGYGGGWGGGYWG